MTALVRDYLLNVAAEGRVVIVGRGAACVLANYPGAFHLFVYASTKRQDAVVSSASFPTALTRPRRSSRPPISAARNTSATFTTSNGTATGSTTWMVNSCMGFDAMLKATVEAAGLAALYSPSGATR